MQTLSSTSSSSKKKYSYVVMIWISIGVTVLIVFFSAWTTPGRKDILSRSNIPPHQTEIIDIIGTFHVSSSSSSSSSWTEVCQTFSISEKNMTNKAIVGFEFSIDHPKSVHHMDLFLCNSNAMNSMTNILCQSGGGLFYPLVSPSRRGCHALAAVYDKGAKSFVFTSQNNGIYLLNSMSTHMMLQIHYIFEEDFVVDRSGFRLYLRDDLSSVTPVRIMGLVDETMKLPRHQERYEHEYTISSAQIRRVLSRDFDNIQGEKNDIYIIAAHFHAHEACVSMSLTKKDGKVVAEINPYNGYE